MDYFADSDGNRPMVGHMMILIAFLMAVPPRAGLAQGEPVFPDTLNVQENPLTLTQAIRIAMANNTDIKRSLLSLKIADEQTQGAWSEVLPEIDANVTYTRNLELPVFFFPADPGDPDSPLRAIQAGEDNNWMGGISVNQTLFRGEAFIGISTSQLYKAVQAESVRATTQQIVTDTRIAYYNVLVAEEQLQLQQESISRLRENLQENRARYQAGLIDRYTVLQVEVQLSNQEPQLTQARYAVEAAYRELKLVMGLPGELPVRVRGNLGEYEIMQETAAVPANRNIKHVNNMTPYGFEIERKLMTIATDMRGDLRVLEQRNELKNQEIKAIKSRFLPTLSSSYNLDYQAQEPGTPNFFGNDQNRVRTQSIMVTLNVPIFDGFQRTTELQIAQIEKKDLELQKSYAVRAAQNQIESTRESLNQAIETAPARQKALDQAREGYERARKRLEIGLGSQIEVTEAEFQLRQAELNYARTVFNYLSAKARYDQAIGLVPYVDKSKAELE